MPVDLELVAQALRDFRSRLLMLSNGLPRRASGLVFGFATAWSLQEGVPETTLSDEVYRIARDLENTPSGNP
jgi:hypothetical protein